MKFLLSLALMLFTTAVGATSSDTIYANGFELSPAPCLATINPDGTPRTRLLTSPVAYGAALITRPAVQLTEYGNVYSYNNAAPGPVLPFPGLTGSAPRFTNFKRNSYIALHFKVPSNMDPRSYGTWSAPSAWPGSLPITVSISRGCGDFSHFLSSPGCVAKNVPAADGPIITWTFSTASPNTSCVLKPGFDYYMNIIQTNPALTPACSGNKCQAPAAWRTG